MKIFGVLFLTIFSFFSVYATQETFLRAHKCYECKDFKQAHELYAAIGNKSAATWYNMGNCCFQLGNYVDAVACWHHAQRGASGAVVEDIAYNIDIAEQKLGLEKQDQSIWTRISMHLKKRMNGFSLLMLQILFLLTWFALFFFIKKRKRGKKYRSLIIGILLMINVFFVLGLTLKYYDALQQKGVVMKQQNQIFAGPNEQYHVVGTLPIASCVKIIEQRGSWCKIKYSQDAGWVKSETLTIV